MLDFYELRLAPLEKHVDGIIAEEGFLKPKYSITG